MAKSVPGDHQVVMVNRHNLEVTGVLSVGSFDETSVVLETTLGLLQIRGRGLHINQLDLDIEKLDVKGEIDAVIYIDGSGELRGKGLLARLLR